ncbi:hypothetical protein MTO96_028668 [Rhipicephalus appendiculatus]
MENAIDPPEKVAEDAVNAAAAAAIDTTPPATANDDETSPSNDDGSAWVLVQKKRRTQAELSVSQPKQGTTPSKLRGNTTQRKPTTSRPPPLPLHDYKAILRPLGGLRLDQWTRPTLTRAIGVAASLPPAEVDRLVFRLRPEQNLAVARMMGKTSTALITFAGLQVLHYIRYYGAEYRCYVHRPCKQVCTVCLRLGHRSDNCPTPKCVTCKTCGVDNPTPGHSCSPRCRSCGGDHPTTDTGCPARVRPPVNKDRVRKALQQEQQQRDVEHHPTPSSSSQGELQAAGSTPGRKSRSRSRSRRGVAEQGPLSYPLQDGFSAATCKACDYFGSHCTIGDEPVFAPIERL